MNDSDDLIPMNDDSGESRAPAPKKRGRRPGSTNKPKAETAPGAEAAAPGEDGKTRRPAPRPRKPRTQPKEAPADGAAEELPNMAESSAEDVMRELLIEELSPLI